MTPTAPTQVTAFGVMPIRKANRDTGVMNLVTVGFKSALIITSHRRLSR